MREIIAIDPGTTESAYVIWDGKEISANYKRPNHEILINLRDYFENIHHLYIEEINPYTMGKTTRDTLLWSGRFYEAWERKGLSYEVIYVSRDQVRKNICGSGGPKINDKVIRQALVDRFAYGQPNFGKGTKKDPGFFAGFSADMWSAFAIAVTAIDMEENNERI